MLAAPTINCRINVQTLDKADIKGCLCLYKHHSPRHTPGLSNNMYFSYDYGKNSPTIEYRRKMQWKLKCQAFSRLNIFWVFLVKTETSMKKKELTVHWCAPNSLIWPYLQPCTNSMRGRKGSYGSRHTWLWMLKGGDFHSKYFHNSPEPCSLDYSWLILYQLLWYILLIIFMTELYYQCLWPLSMLMGTITKTHPIRFCIFHIWDMYFFIIYIVNESRIA